MKTRKRPDRFLVGVGSVLAGAGLLSGCHGSSGSNAPGARQETAPGAAIAVRRAHYASLSACQADGSADDCRFVSGEGAPAAAPTPPVRTASPAASATPGPPGGAPPLDEPGWYGAYYTEGGVIYHASGLVGIGAVPHADAAGVSQLTVRDCALQADSGAFDRTPRAEVEAENRVVSRGGFVCPRQRYAPARDDSDGTGGGGGGSGFHGGERAHGGGEGGAHGGGGRGSGGG